MTINRQHQGTENYNIWNEREGCVTIQEYEQSVIVPNCVNGNKLGLKMFK